MQMMTKKPTRGLKKKDKIHFPIYHDRVSSSRSRKVDEGPLTVDDICDIESTIFSIQHPQTSALECGWTSPLKSSTPLKSRIIPKSPSLRAQSSHSSVLETNSIQTNKTNLQNNSSKASSHTAKVQPSKDEGSDDDGIERAWEKIRRQMFPELDPLPPTPQPQQSKIHEYEPQTLGYSRLFDDTMIEDNAAISPIKVLQSVEKTQKTVQSHKPPLHPPAATQLSSAILDKENNANSFFGLKLLNNTYTLPVRVQDKLRLAEREYELELARYRKAELIKLKQSLSEGGDLYIKEAEKHAIDSLSKQKRVLLDCIERYVYYQCVRYFSTDQTTLPDTKALEQIVSKIPKKITQAIDDLFEKTKATYSRQLAEDLQAEAMRATREIESYREQSRAKTISSLDLKTGLTNDEIKMQEKVLKDFDDMASKITSLTLSSIYPKDSTQKKMARLEQIKAIEKLQIYQIRLQRQLQEEEENLRRRLLASNTQRGPDQLDSR